MPAVKPLLLDVFELARERRTLEGEVALAELPRLAASLLKAEGGRLQYRIRGAVDERGRPGAEMSLSACLPLECQRCNRELAYSLKRDAHFRFVASEEELNALPIEEDDIDVIVGSRYLDVAAWIEDEAILSLPIVPRHDDCRPAASVAAAPAVSNGEGERPNPFAVLAGLKSGPKSG